MPGFPIILATVCILISLILALILGGAANPMRWALWAIFIVLFWGVRSPWG
jgi:hypothetical protein